MTLPTALVSGAPEDVASRADREARCYRFLDGAGIPYMRMDHPPAETMEICRMLDERLDAVICKNLFLCNRQETAFYLLMMPGNKPFHTRLLSKALGVSRLSFAKEEAMVKYLDLYPGSVSILGLMNDRENSVRLVADRELLKYDHIGCHPCVNTSSLRLSRDDMFLRLPALLKHPVSWVEMPRDADDA